MLTHQPGCIINETMVPMDVLSRFDVYLAGKSLSFDAVVIGGAALFVLGVINRQTDDCDVLYPRIPNPIREAAEEFADHYPAEVLLKEDGEGILLEDGSSLPQERTLDRDWFNDKSGDFVETPGALVEGWKDRLVPLYQGRALNLKTLARRDLLYTKLLALVDRGFDYDDCVAMQPSAEDLVWALPRSLPTKETTLIGKALGRNWPKISSTA